MALTVSTIRRWSALGAALLLLAGTVAACGSSDDDGGGAGTSAGTTQAERTTGDAGSGGGAGSAATTLTLAASEQDGLSFTKKTLHAKAGSVTLSMQNPDGNSLPHAIAVEGNGVDEDGETVQPGGTSTITVKLKPGTYDFYCPVGGHEQAGMKGELVVR